MDTAQIIPKHNGMLELFICKPRSLTSKYPLEYSALQLIKEGKMFMSIRKKCLS